MLHGVSHGMRRILGPAAACLDVSAGWARLVEELRCETFFTNSLGFLVM